MTWISYPKGIKDRIIGYPSIGDRVLYRRKYARHAISIDAEIKKVITHRKYIISYDVPDDVRHHFINGTTSSIADLEELSFFCDE